MIGSKAGRKSAVGPVHATSNQAAYTDEETEFLIEVNKWKQKTGTRFPAATEYLTILKAMGYRKGQAMEGLREVDVIMMRIKKYLNNDPSAYNRVYEEFMELVNKKEKYRKMVENLTQDA